LSFTVFHSTGSASIYTLGRGTISLSRWPKGLMRPAGFELERSSFWNSGFNLPTDPRLAIPWKYGFLRNDHSNGGKFWGFTLTYPTVLTLAAAGFTWWIDARSKRRSRVGQCMQCGYERAGLSATASCPECGSSA
jgi:hypothetical protein